MEENQFEQIYVIIPVYNCKNYLITSVNSVLEQNYPGISIIIVDDGSTDGSSQLCDELASKYDNIITIHQKNGGVSSARNTAIDYLVNSGINNGYISFLDADDFWSPHFFDEDIVKIINQKYTLISFTSTMCDEKCKKRTSVIPIEEGLHEGGAKAAWIVSYQHFGAMLYSIKLINDYNLRFMPTKYCEDVSFRMQCLYLTDTIYLHNSLLYYYRMNHKSAVHNRNFGISYFPQIIDTWIKTDEKMSVYANDKRGKLDEGKKLAKIFIMDMIDEHYQFFGNEKEIDIIMKSHPEYQKLLESNWGEKKQHDRYQYMLNHPIAYKVKQYCKGIFIQIKVIIMRGVIVREIVYRYRFKVPMNID